MERRYDNNFEKLLKDNANQYKMYPSEKVWKGIHSQLHTRRKWYGISALVFLLISGAGLSLFVFIDQSNEKINTKTNNLLTTNNTQIQSSGLSKKPLFSKATAKEFSRIKRKPMAITKAKENISHKNSSVSVSVDKNLNSSFQSEQVKSLQVIVENSSTENNTLILENNNNEFIKLPENSTGISSENGEENLTIKSNDALNKEIKLKADISALASQNAPILISRKLPRMTAQVYFTPTISYRKLSENKNSYSNGVYSYSQIVDVNNMVKHKPLMGLEFGIDGKYRVNDKFFLKTGLQFNINRYDINAYTHPTEIASVSINNGFQNYTLSSLSNYGNFSGNTQNWLENFYFQAAVPVGAELIISKNDKLSWGISGTLQPTYLIGDRAYLISSDYKNYAKFPDLMRRWNLSSGIETFVSYSTGRIKWQTGPHLRYQHLSSFVSGYPVKENLFAIGLKVSASIIKK